MSRARAALVIAAALLAAPAGADAAPTIDRGALLSAATPSFAWDGQQAQAAAPQQSAQGFDPNLCSKEPTYYCDVTLVKLDAAPDTTAELEFAIFDFSVPVADFDISIYESDERGEPGKFIANGGNLSAAGLEETVEVPEAAPGYYLVTVSYYFSPDASYKGTIKATGITPPPAPPAPPAPAPAPAPASPAPASGPLPLTLPATLKRARVALRASEPITDLTLALRDRRGRVVASARTANLPAGRRTLRLKARRRLKPGRYTLVAIGVAGGAKRTATRTVLVRAG